MTDSIYTDIAEELRRLGGIDEVGVVSAVGKTAVIYSGNKILKKYYGDTRKVSLIFSVSGMDKNAKQEALVQKLCGICEELKRAKPRICGVYQPTIRISTLPTPTTHNEQYWIYTASVEFTYYEL